MKLLVAYDKNTSMSTVLSNALKIAKQFKAMVYLVRTCKPETRAREIAEMESRLNEIGNDLFKKEGIETRSHVLIRGMAPGEDIVNFAKEKAVDQIIIGVKKRSRVGKMLTGSTAQFIILEAHCPVLSVK